MKTRLDDDQIDELLRWSAERHGGAANAAPDCPPYPQLKRSARSNSWLPEIASHVRGCRLCRRALVIHYEYEHIRWSDLERYVRDPESMSVAAPAIHDHTDSCTRCRAKLVAVRLGAIDINVNLGTAFAFAPVDEPECTTMPTEVVEKQIRVTVVNSGGEYIAHVDATGPVSTVTLVVAEPDSTEREYEVVLQELDLADTPYLWYGAKSLGPLHPAENVDQTWMVKAYIVPGGG